MQKLITIIVSIILLITFYQYMKYYSYGISLRSYGEKDEIYEMVLIDESDIINDIILLPNGEFSEKEAAKMIQTLHNIPSTLLENIRNHKIKVQLFTGSLTDFPMTNHLKGIIPRGYASGITWDEVPGIGGGRIVLVKLGHSERGAGHGSINLELHELAHSIDKIVYNGIRHQQQFLSIWEKEKHELFPNHHYFISFPEEYFAEAFAYYYFNEQSHTFLKKHGVETYNYIKALK